jgi:hypothetical protein
MIYLLVAALPYLALGVLLTRSLRRGASARPLRANDIAVGALFMPLISLVTLACTVINAICVRLLILLDFEPGDRPPAPADGRNR